MRDGLSIAMESLAARAESLAIKLAYPGVINIEDAKTVEVGTTYFFPVATTRKDSIARGAHFPILGDAPHEDNDFIPLFPDNVPHWHVDWRPIPTELYPGVVKMFLGIFGQNAEAFDVENGGYAPGTRNLQLACVLPASVIASVQRWPLPVFRQQLRWEALPDWLGPLEEAYKDKKVCKNICPHRGISLVGAPKDENGVRVCPGHGLAWDKKGCLVPRTRKNPGQAARSF